MHERETNVVSIISAFALGGLIGAGVALLMAPQSGEETRNMIRNRSEELRERAMDTAEETRHRAESAMDDLAKQTRQQTEEMRRRG